MGALRKLVLYIAQSVDGYIARADESLDWLLNTQGQGDNGYSSFYDTVDTILLGRRTYDWILKNAWPAWPYQGKECYVFSRQMSGRTEHVEFVSDDIVKFTRALKNQAGKDIWIVGGGEVLHPLLRDELVDEFIIHIAPRIIGQGIPLFKAGEYELDLELVCVRQHNQFAQVHYKLT